jgi:hypothetical protein
MNEDHQVDTPVYQIKVQGILDEKWCAWFNGMAIAHETDSDGASLTILTGAIIDQARLRGILDGMWNLNLTVVSVKRIKSEKDSSHL